MYSTKTDAEDPVTVSTAKVIEKLHSMSWLKHDHSHAQNSNTPRFSGKDGQIVSAKKTDEDYFPGTRDEKRSKKKKERKVKSVLTMNDLKDYMHSHNEKTPSVVVISDSTESLNPSPIVSGVTENFLSPNTNTANSTIWSATTSTADKLFPNVQSVVIDRAEEEEMLTRAIAESIASIQLEQFNKPSPVLEKGNRWEALYGDKDDESGWDNVRRNLPTGSEATIRAQGTSAERNICDGNNNNSKPSILRNKKKGLLSDIKKGVEKLDFGFKTSIEISAEEIESPRSQKSVSFEESISIKVHSTDSSESDEPGVDSNHEAREPRIDKFGRVDGYSERRLFMGKGARMKEQEYIQNIYGKQKAESHLQATEIVNTQKSASIASSRCYENLQTQKSVVKVEEMTMEKGLTVDKIKERKYVQNDRRNNNLQSNSVTRSQKPKSNFPQRPENLQPQRSVSKFKKTESRDAVVVESFKTPKQRSERNINNIRNLNEQRDESIVKSLPVELCTQIRKENNGEIDRVTENGKTLRNTSSQTLDKAKNKPKPNVSSNRQRIDCQSATEFENIQLKDFVPIYSKTEKETEGRCLVPTFIKDDNWMPEFSTADLCVDSTETSSIDFESAAYQNLLLTGMSIMDINSNPLNLLRPNYSDENATPPITLSSEYQSLDNTLQVGSEYINDVMQAYESTQLPDYDVNSIIPNFYNSANVMQMSENTQLEYEDFFRQTLNPNSNASDCIEELRNILSSRNNLPPPPEKTETIEPNQYSTTRAPPGLIKNLQLPPGFTKLEYDRRNSSPAVNQSVNYNRNEQRNQDEVSPKMNYNELSLELGQRNYRPELTGDGRASVTPGNRRMPHPILGANHKADGNQTMVKNSSNWRYNSDFINRMLVPMNFIPNHPKLMLQSHQNSPANFIPTFRSPIRQGQAVRQMFPPVLSPVQISRPRYLLPQRLLHVNVKDELQNFGAHNFLLGGTVSPTRWQVQQSIGAERSYVDYNFNQHSMSPLVANASRFSDPRERQGNRNTGNSPNLDQYIPNDYMH